MSRMSFGESGRLLTMLGVAGLWASAACGGSGVDREGDADAKDTSAETDSAGEMPEDTAPDVPDADDADDAADVGDVADAELGEEVAEVVADVDEDVPELPKPGTFVSDEADLPDEYVFKSVWAGEAGNIVAVGNDGIVASQSPDGAWKVLALEQGVDLLNAVHGHDKDHLFAVGIDGAMLQGSTTSFKRLSTGVDDTLWAVHGIAEDRAFAVGRGGIILSWDGVRWAPSTGADASAVWNGISAKGTTVALVGNGGQAVLSRGGGIEPVATGVGWNLHGVHTLDGDEFFAVGDQGTLLHGTGTSWGATDLGLVVSLRDVHGVAADDVYAVGYGGSVVHWDGASWSLEESPTTSSLLGVWVEGDGDVVLVGQDGLVFEGDRVRGFAQTAELALGGELVDVWGTPDDALMIAVGAQGRIFARADGTWSEMQSPTSQALESVWGTSATDIWAVGRSGLAVHWDGEAWTRVETPVTALIAAVWGDSESRYLAAGSGGTLLAWNGSAWLSVASGTKNNLRALESRDGDVWTVGAQATILRFNGLGWGGTKVQGIPNADGGEDPITEELFAVWMAARDDGWAVGENGRILHWDGTMWAIVETEWTTSLRGIYGLASNDVWAVGTAGHIIHWNGEAWEKVPTTTIATLYAIHGDGVNVVVVGDLGTVLRLDR